MTNFSVEDLFCCPICKSSLVYGSGVFRCSFCGEKFSKEGDIYDFRVKIDTWDKKKIDKYEKLILRNKHSKWFNTILKHLSQVEYIKILLDSHLKEIDEYINNLIKKGINVGKRYEDLYEDTVLPQDSIRDLHVATAMRYINMIRDRSITIDLGCGTLRITKELLKMGFKKIIAIDLLPEVMSYGYTKLNDRDKKKVIMVKGDVRFLPIRECSIDLVFSLELFEHIDVPILLLLDIKRVLKNDGLAVINTWNALELRNHKIIRQRGRSYYENGFFYKFYNFKELQIILRQLDVDFIVRPHGYYLERRFLNMLGKNFVIPLAKIDHLFSFLLPQFMFHRFIFAFKKKLNELR